MSEYVYDLDEVRRCYGLLRSSLPQPSEIYYSLKANPHPFVVRTLREQGCLAEVCSPGELRVALEAGYDGEQLLYTGPGKRDEDLREAVKEGVTQFSVDSPFGLDQLNALGVPVKAIVRINDEQPVPGHGLTMTGVPSQFGADLTWVLREPEAFGSRENVAVVGFHLYMGTNISDEGALLNQFRQAARTARRLAAETGLGVEVLDLGGGFGAPFARAGQLPVFPGLADGLADLLDETFPGWRSGWPVVAFESGRYLTATCGTLRTRVLDVKRSQERPVLVLESGVNHLGGMSGLRRLPPIVPDVQAPGSPVPDTIVAGPLCTPVDTWARAADVAPVSPGDVVSVPNVGAYGLYASLVAFLGHPLADEVVVDGGVVVDESRLELRRERGL
ncbi:decarboxylase [Lentzea guizhouensis]|uniref:Decarboxylase n=1 Tax=Lentzea guizhouensis TaxID=1586287 RepID=A0A1B2HMX8_9PSEU|nr:decarboxylase [Lentzea guizhouensis]ANZ39060.1 decarboxylase [Lentzea guizhouensis]